MTIFNAQDPQQPLSPKERTQALDLSQFVVNEHCYQANRLIPDTVESLAPLKAACEVIKKAYYKAHEIEIETAARLGADPRDLRDLAPDVPVRTRIAACKRVMEFFENQVDGHSGLFLDFGAYARHVDRVFEDELRTVVERKPGRQPFPVRPSLQVVTHNLALIVARQAVESSNREQREGCLKIIDSLAESTQGVLPDVSDTIKRLGAELRGNPVR